MVREKSGEEMKRGEIELGNQICQGNHGVSHEGEKGKNKLWGGKDRQTHRPRKVKRARRKVLETPKTEREKIYRLEKIKEDQKDPRGQAQHQNQSKKIAAEKVSIV